MTFQKKKKSARLGKFSRKPQDLSSGGFLDPDYNFWSKPEATETHQSLCWTRGRKSNYYLGIAFGVAGYTSTRCYLSSHSWATWQVRKKVSQLQASQWESNSLLHSSQMLIFSICRNSVAPKPALTAKISEQSLLHSSIPHTFTVLQKDVGFLALPFLAKRPLYIKIHHVLQRSKCLKDKREQWYSPFSQLYRHSSPFKSNYLCH